MLTVVPLRFAGSREADDADTRLSEWTDAYHRLKISQGQLKAAGTGATLQMRADRDRLQRVAEHALKALIAQGEAARPAPAAGSDKPRSHGASASGASPAPSSLHGLHRKFGSERASASP